MNKPDFDCYIVDTIDLFNSLNLYAQQVMSDDIILDVETNSKCSITAELYGFGISFTDKKAFYIPWRTPEGVMVWDTGKQAIISKWLHDNCGKFKLINHNIIYDVLVLENNLGYDFSQLIYSDTILLKHALDETKPFGLKELAVKELGDWADLAQEKLKQEVLDAGGRWNEDQKDMYLASTATLGEYCCWDVILTRLLYKIYSARLKEEGLEDLFYKEETMPLYKEVTIDMKRKGFPIDIGHFENLKVGLTKGIEQAEDEVMQVVAPLVSQFEETLLNTKYPSKPKGLFPKVLAEVIGAPLPKKGDKITIGAKDVEKQIKLFPKHKHFYEWLLGKRPRPIANDTQIYEAKKRIHFAKPANKGNRHVFNIKSTDHLRHLFITKLGYTPIKKSEKTGKPTVDEDFINTVHTYEQDPAKRNVLDKIVDYKKLNKLLSTYVIGILDRSINNKIHTDMLQFGTISGRYSSSNPNLQNQPRIKDEDSGLSPVILKYTNEIRKGFVAGPGYKVVNADYSSLEPVCFAHMSGDEKLRDVFRNGYDLYSTVAIDVFGLTDYSADKSAENYLGKHKKEFRQKAKIFCLAVVYGAEAAQVAKSMNLSWAAANQLIESYLNAYPNLKKYMAKCNYSAKKKGMVQTEFGRIRHLKEARAMHVLYGDKVLEWKWANKMGQMPIRKKLKNALNNAKNYPIQGLAAHIVNRAMIATNRAFKQHNIDGWLALQVHDEITCIVREDHAALAAQLLQQAMEDTTIISVPLKAEPLIANNWAEAK